MTQSDDKNKPLVSIVVVTYNSAKTVIETLESIKAQTYQNLELIVTDDCSTDNTCEIVKNWLSLYFRRFVNVELVKAEKNTGVSGNINRGVAKTHGEWIKSIAGDDLLVPTAIEEYVNFISSYPERVRMCVCYVEPFATDGAVSDNLKKAYQNFFLLESEDYEKQRKRVMTTLVFVGPAFFYSRELYDEVGGYSEEYGCAEEWPFVYKIIMGGNRIYALNKKLVRYRIQSTSLCHSKTESGLGNKRVFYGMYSHFFDHAFKDLLYDVRPLTAWHYSLVYLGGRLQYHIKSGIGREIVAKGLLLFSPMSYLRLMGIGYVI